MRDHLNSLHILSQDAVFIERSSIQEAALYVLLYNKSVQDLLFVANISQEEVITSFYLHSCYVVAGQASMHFRLVVFAICVCVCVFAKHTRDNTNDMAVQVRTLHTGRGAGCHLISFSRPAQSKFEVQPPPEHHFVEQHTHYCSVTQECGPCSACSAYCTSYKCSTI